LKPKGGAKNCGQNRLSLGQGGNLNCGKVGIFLVYLNVCWNIDISKNIKNNIKFCIEKKAKRQKGNLMI
jgi:hypothetical protein